MTDSPPPEPPSRQNPLGFDDFVGVFVALTGIGAILVWAIGGETQGFNLPSFESIAASPAPTVASVPTPSSSGQSIQSPAPAPSASTQDSIQPAPQTTPQTKTVPFVPVPVPAASASPVATGFSDVSSDLWAAPFIGLLAQRGIIAGSSDGTFRPNASVTRAEFATMLQKAFDQPGKGQALRFSDVPSSYWANSAIAESVQTGFMRGYPGSIFRPGQQISKMEMLIALESGLDLPNPADPAQVVSYYQDAGQIPQYAIDKVAAATTNQLVVNYPNPKVLMPNQAASRADAAALIYQALVKTGKADRVSSQYIVQP